MGGSSNWAICRTRRLRFNYKRCNETSKGLSNRLMYNLLSQLQRCKRSIRKTKTLHTDKTTHKYTLILSHIIIMLKTSLEIAIRLIFHDYLTPGSERVKCDEPWVCCADWPPRLLVGASPQLPHAPKPKDYCKARRHV